MRGRWLAAGFLAFVAACGDAPKNSNILLVTLDTTRADHLGSYGYFRDTSPTIDRLARESIVFERAIAPMSRTLPTHLSILTGAYPLEHGVLSEHWEHPFTPSPGLQSFVTVAREAGYRTGAFVSSAPLKRGSGIEIDFETYDEPPGAERGAGATTDAALRWLDATGRRPFLLWVHYFDPHWPYSPPDPYDKMYRIDDALEAFIAERRIHARASRPGRGVISQSRRSINAYDGEIRYLDAQLRRLFDWLRSRDEWQSTVVLLVGDHGEGLGQHGTAGHGGTWNEQLHVPMMIRVPGVLPRRISRVISTVDTLPTLLGLIDDPAFVDFDQNTSGRNVLAGASKPEPVLSRDMDTPRGRHGYSLTLHRWKYVWKQKPGGKISEQLYDLRADPYELRNIAEQRVGVVNDMRERMSALRQQQRERGETLRAGASPARRAMDPLVREQLRILGYVEEGTDPSPRQSDQ